MGQMLVRGKVMIRIHPEKKDVIEVSDDGGRNWHTRYNGNHYLIFEELTDNGKEVLAMTNKGLHYSNDNGINWLRRG